MNIIKKITKIILFIIFISSIGMLYLLSDFNPMFKNKDFQQLENQISISNNPDLNEIVAIYEKTRNLNSVFGQIISNKKNPRSESPAIIAVYLANPHLHHETYINSLIISIKYGIYAYKLESKYSSNNLIKFQLENSDYLYGNIGVRKAAKFYFDKDLHKLNEDEILTLILMLDNPSLYNPIRHSDRVMNKLKFYQDLLQK